MNDSFAQRQISTIYGQANQYRVVLEALPMYQRDPSILSKLYLPGARRRAGAAVGGRDPEADHRAACDFAPGAVSRGHAQLQPRARRRLERRRRGVKTIETRIGMPGSIVGLYAGDAAEFSKSLAGQPWLILAAIVTIYIVLGVLYESYIHPITILSTLPSAGVGAIVALMLFGQDLSVIGLIGIILLMGIVKKNAIMMIDFALEAERHQGLPPTEAIVQACLLRFRPIMMTTLAALFGALPLAVESGTGAELRFPLGISIIGGLLLSQLLTLYTTPVIYLALDRINRPLEQALPPAGADGPPVAGATEGIMQRTMASISEPFVRRPVGTTLLSIGLFLVGGVAYAFLPVARPNVDFPAIWVVATPAGRRSPPSWRRRLPHRWSGISAKSPASTRSLRPARSAPPASSCSSRSAATSTAPRATCRPPSMPRSPTCRAICRRCRASARPIRSAQPVFVLALTSKTMTTGAIYDVADSVLAQRLSQVPGVGDVTVTGADQPAVRIALNPVALVQCGHRHRRRRRRDRQRQSARAGRHLQRRAPERDDRRSIRRCARRRSSATSSSRAPTAASSGSPTSPRSRIRPQRPLDRLVQQAAGGADPDHQAGGCQRDRHRRPGKALIPELKQLIPAGIDVSTLVDRTDTIRASVGDMQFTLLATAILVMLVVFVFLRRTGADGRRRRFGAAGARRDLRRRCGWPAIRSTISR